MTIQDLGEFVGGDRRSETRSAFNRAINVFGKDVPR